MPNIEPTEILAAGSLLDVAVTPAQAEAVSAQLAVYDAPSTPCQGLRSWRIPPRDEAFSDANTPGVGPLEVHFHYLREANTPADGTPGLEVTVYRPDGTVTDSQDFG